jgi:catechol 2,3-dioxygenase-like lactoylglutathione lyase family enzyme
MDIIGPDALIFGVEDVGACVRYLTDYGLKPVDIKDSGGRFEALDGTYIDVKGVNDPSLPAPMDSATTLRKTIYGVAGSAALAAIAKELGTDRKVKVTADGSLETVDDMGFVLGFQLTVRKPIAAPAERVNAPGSPPQRPVNELGVSEDATIMPRSLSHVVYFVPDAEKAESFYKRLGFRCTDRFIGVGPFLQPAASLDHHTLFMIQTPPHMKGCEHFTFHLGGPTEVLQAGTRFVNKGYTSFWGPGRHKMGSNWFWYFNSPFKCHVEYDADMDLHDAEWKAREAKLDADASQLFLFTSKEKWAPTGPPPRATGV